MQLSSNRGLLIRYFHHFGLSLHYINNSIRKFAAEHDLIFFVSDLKSSNGKVLFEECKLHNSNSHFISSVDIIDVDLLKNVTSIGICGATSTPKWQMEEVKHKIEESLYTI